MPSITMSPTIKPMQFIFKVLCIIALGTLIYSNSFHGVFVFDDTYFIVRNTAIKHLNRIDTIFWDNVTPLRFLPFLSFAVNYSVHQLDVFGFHLVNFFIHLINTFLIWFFVSLTLKTPKYEGEGRLSFLPFSVALLFLSHPLATESVTYISQRFTSMVACFYILTLCLYAQFRLKGKWIYLGGAVISAVCAMFSKQTAMTLPLIILLYEHLFFEGNRKIKWGIGCLFLFIALIIPTFYSFRITDILSISMRSGSHLGDQLTPAVYLLTQFRVVVTYLRLILWPYPQNFLYDFPASTTLFEINTFLCLIVLIALIWFAIYVIKKDRLVAFGIFWFLGTLLVESTVIVIGHVIFEHRTYLPSVGIFLSLTVLAARTLKSRKCLYAIIALVVCALSILTFQRNKVWTDRVSFWQDVIKKSPNLIRPYLNLGVAYIDKEEYEKAIDQFNKAIAKDVAYAEAYNNRGLAFMRQQKFENAFKDFNKAMELGGDYLNAYHNRGTLFSKVGKFNLALEDLTKALEINPTHPESYNERGSVLFFLNQYDEAIEDFARAILYDPANIKAYNNRGAVYNAIGEYEIAIRDFKKTIRLNPYFAPAYYNLSYAYYRTGDIEKAKINVHKAKDLGYNVHPGYLEDLYSGE